MHRIQPSLSGTPVSQIWFILVVATYGTDIVTLHLWRQPVASPYVGCQVKYGRSVGQNILLSLLISKWGDDTISQHRLSTVKPRNLSSSVGKITHLLVVLSFVFETNRETSKLSITEVNQILTNGQSHVLHMWSHRTWFFTSASIYCFYVFHLPHIILRRCHT